MAAEDLLRLAWEADHDGRPSLRDSLLTLAITESGPDDDWPERCRSRLVAERPDHYLGSYPSVRAALEDPRVQVARDRLRRKYPAERVDWLLLRARASRGPYTGRGESVDSMIEDLAGPRAEVENVRLDLPAPARGPRSGLVPRRTAVFSLAYPPMPDRGGPDVEGAGLTDDRQAPSIADDPFAQRHHYYSVVFALAMVLAALPEEDGPSLRTRPISA